MFFKKFLSFLKNLCHKQETKLEDCTTKRVRNPNEEIIEKPIKKNRKIMKGKENKKEKKVPKVVMEIEKVSKEPKKMKRK